jgi:hypothetical protein
MITTSSVPARRFGGWAMDILQLATRAATVSQPGLAPPLPASSDHSFSAYTDHSSFEAPRSRPAGRM